MDSDDRTYIEMKIKRSKEILEYLERKKSEDEKMNREIIQLLQDERNEEKQEKENAEEVRKEIYKLIKRTNEEIEEKLEKEKKHREEKEKELKEKWVIWNSYICRQINNHLKCVKTRNGVKEEDLNEILIGKRMKAGSKGKKMKHRVKAREAKILNDMILEFIIKSVEERLEEKHRSGENENGTRYGEIEAFLIGMGMITNE